MLQEDPRRTHVSPAHAQLVALYESTNQPVVQPAGRAAQAAQGVVCGLLHPHGYEVLVALTLTQTGENVLYVGEPVPEPELSQALEEALTFAESMGFMLDSSGWQNLDEAHREDLIARLPAFREPQEAPKPPAPLERTRAVDPLAAVARLFAAFALALCASLAACAGMSSEQRAKAAEIHYDLGTNLLNAGDAQGAMNEYLQAVDSDPDLPDVHNGLGLVYWYSFGRLPDAQREFEKALDLNPAFSEARTNLGALDIARGRFKEAIPLLEKSAADPLYKQRVLAQSNLGWALYKSGSAEKGVGQIRAALQVTPNYCLGWRQLGVIYSEQGKLEDARDAFGRYTASCPDSADAHLQSGKVLARLSHAKEAQEQFAKCAEARAEKDKQVASECGRYLKELGTP